MAISQEILQSWITKCSLKITYLSKISFKSPRGQWDNDDFYSSDINRTASSKASCVPTPDQQLALAVLLELAVQRGSLNHILQAVLLLLSLWNGSRHDADNRLSSNLISAPLIPLLQRFQDIPTPRTRIMDAGKFDEVILKLSPIHHVYLEMILESNLWPRIIVTNI